MIDYKIKMDKQYKPQDYRSSLRPTWCKGCSFYSIYNVLTEIFADKSILPNKISVVSGIGCSSRLPLFCKTSGLHTIHGRAIPVAIGIRLVNPENLVIVTAGDGDIFSIGLSHFVHAARKNFNITVICIDNQMYAMTKKQSSPTSTIGFKGTLSPYGEISKPLNVIGFALQCGATFVANTFTGAKIHMKRVLVKALEHVGFSFVNIISPCKKFDPQKFDILKKNELLDINEELKINSLKDKIESLRIAEYLFDPTYMPNKIPVGIFREIREPTFEERMEELKNKYNSPMMVFDDVIKKYLLSLL